jgi:hypothetical protein
VKGIHSDESLKEKDLRPDSLPPIQLEGDVGVTGSAIGLDEEVDIEDEIRRLDEEEVAPFDSDDEQGEDEEDLNPTCEDQETSEQMEDEDNMNVEGPSDPFGDGDGDTGGVDGDEDHTGTYDDEFLSAEQRALEAEKEAEGDEIKEKGDLLCVDIAHIQVAIQNLLSLPSSHPHLREVPTLELSNMPAIKDWANRCSALQTMRVFPTTWG